MNEIIISNIVRKNDVNFRIFYAKEHKIVLTAMDYEKIAVKEITLDVVVNRTLEELEEFFIKYNPDKLDNIYNNKSYDEIKIRVVKGKKEILQTIGVNLFYMLLIIMVTLAELLL